MEDDHESESMSYPPDENEKGITYFKLRKKSSEDSEKSQVKIL